MQVVQESDWLLDTFIQKNKTKTLNKKYTLLTIGREETTQRAWKEGKTLKFAIISHNCSTALGYNDNCTFFLLYLYSNLPRYLYSAASEYKCICTFLFFFSFWNHLSQLLCQLKATRNHWHQINTVLQLNASKLIFIKY